MSKYEGEISTKVMDAISSLKKRAEAPESDDEMKVDLLSIVKKLTRNRENKSKEGEE